MAELNIDADELVLHLSAAEKVEGVHGDLRIPRSAMRSVEVIDDAHRAAGLRAGVKIGTRIPGVVEVGIVQGRSRRRFVAVHHNTPRGLRIQLDGTPFDEWIVGCADPEAVAAQLRLPGQP
ncbi:MAG: hypothetical protein LBI49_07745 [Nocardiopsaceae bacterium]|jgi:hypothetical protein|nr:hypothetical protein [Nocardiopsaceae bacterium]